MVAQPPAPAAAVAVASPPSFSPAPHVAAAVGAALDRVPASLDAATRETIERIVWEIVPELAETIIREELARLLKARGVG